MQCPCSIDQWDTMNGRPCRSGWWHVDKWVRFLILVFFDLHSLIYQGTKGTSNISDNTQSRPRPQYAAIGRLQRGYQAYCWFSTYFTMPLMIHWFLDTFKDTEGHLQCKVWWHEESQRPNSWLDHTSRTAIESSVGSQRQNWLRFSSRMYGRIALSYWFRLVWRRVRSYVLH